MPADVLLFITTIVLVTAGLNCLGLYFARKEDREKRTAVTLPGKFAEANRKTA
jgi:hypothetical protein